MTDVQRADTGFRLTGYHVLAMLIAFFAVVFVVNGVMMRAAIGTFSGVETDTPYKRGLAYNTQIGDGRRQDALGWRVDETVVRGGDGTAAIEVTARDRDGAPLAGVEALVRLERPVDRRSDRTAELGASGAGRFAGRLGDVPPGQWDVVVELSEKGERRFQSRNRVILK